MRDFVLLPVVIFLGLIGLAHAFAEESRSDTELGERLLDGYLRAQTRKIADACLADLTTKEDWEKKRPELRRQFFEMMGLWPLPARTDLHPVVTSKIENDRIVVENIFFQSSPGLYVTGNLYRPKKVESPLPAVLYVCGHGATIVNKLSFGNKVTYQHHPAWLAEHGYVCLIIDTLQLGEIQGLHHGTCNLKMWWWQTLGYTPAGIECWNAMRALDYLETRPEVDPKRIGATGRSGGGATSWWIAAADDRVKCIIPVAGIADLWSHAVEGVGPRFNKGVISGHCDCMYYVNTYRWDFAVVGALCAPRPLLLGNSDSDDIFPVPGYRRFADKVRKVYRLYGAEDKFQLLETAGPHKDTPELRLGAFRWLNRWLKNDESPVEEPERPRFAATQLQVAARVPEDSLNATIHETFLKPASIDLPQSPSVAASWWEGESSELRRQLREKVFAGWPSGPPPLDAKSAGEISRDGLKLRAYDFTSEEAVPLRLWLLTAEKVAKPSLVVLTAVDEKGWRDWLSELGPDFKNLLQATQVPKRDAEKFAQTRALLAKNQWAFATIAPRGVGPTRWAEEGSAVETHIKRRFALLGQTLDGQRVWDVRRALAVLREQKELHGAPLWLQGKGDAAGMALYAGLFEPDVARLDLWNPPNSHRQGPIFLNVRRYMDMPQAVALAFPKAIRLYVQDDAEAKSWEWPLELQNRLGLTALKIRQVRP